MVFIKRGIFVLPGTRCCNEHLYKKQLSYEALNQISVSECGCILVNSDQLNQMLVSFRLAIQNQKIFDFDDPTCMDDTAYYNNYRPGEKYDKTGSLNFGNRIRCNLDGDFIALI